MDEQKLKELIERIEQADLTNESEIDSLLEQALEFDEDKETIKKGFKKFTEEELVKRKELKTRASKFLKDNDLKYEETYIGSGDSNETRVIKSLTQDSSKRIIDMYCKYMEEGDYEQAKVCKYIIEHGQQYSSEYIANGEIGKKIKYKSIDLGENADKVTELETGLRKYEKQQELFDSLARLKAKVRQAEYSEDISRNYENEVTSEEYVQTRSETETQQQEQLQEQEKRNVEIGVWRLFVVKDNLGMNDYAYKMMTLRKELKPSERQYLQQILHNKDLINKIVNKEIPEDTIKQVEGLLSKDDKDLQELSDESYRKGMELLEKKLAEQKRIEEQEARAKAEQKAKIKAEQEARAKAEQESKIKAERKARAKAEQEAKIKAEREARAKAEQEARIKAEQEARVKAEQEAKVKAEQETKEYEQPQEEKIRPQEQSIKDKVEDMQDKESQQIIQSKNQKVDMWMNRFNGWYSAIDKVSQNVKNKFVKMKSDITKAIRDIVQERRMEKQKSTQEKDSNER